MFTVAQVNWVCLKEHTTLRFKLNIIDVYSLWAVFVSTSCCWFSLPHTVLYLFVPLCFSTEYSVQLLVLLQRNMPSAESWEGKCQRRHTTLFCLIYLLINLSGPHEYEEQQELLDWLAMKRRATSARTCTQWEIICCEVSAHWANWKHENLSK